MKQTMNICCHQHAAIGKPRGCYELPKDEIRLMHDKKEEEFWRNAAIRDAANKGMLPLSYPNGYIE